VRNLERLWRWCRREPRLAGMALGLFIMLAAVAVLLSSLYYREKERSRIQQENSQLVRQIYDRIKRELERFGQTRVYSEDLALVGGKQESPHMGEEVFLGVHTTRRGSNPIRIVGMFAPLVNALQTNLVGPNRVPALLQMEVHISEENAMQSFLEGNVHLLRPDPASYVLARQTNKSIVPLVQQSYGKQPGLRTVIFAKANSGLTNLADLKGRSIGFGEPNSAKGHYLPRAALMKAGLCFQDLLHVTNVPSAWVVSAVESGQVAAGVADWDQIADLNQTRPDTQFRILEELPCPSPPWITTTNLNPKIASAIQEHLLSLRDSNVLMAVDYRLKGFQPVQPSDYDDLKRQIEMARQFDADNPIPPNQP
jgi:phosphonate transport system substrate-binding protein